ncbi:MAG: hypothetical protein E6K91_01680 [Thaumarchaeota archaeon]|nr:MAG: hypothetical protein E6K91_01680 [Nitrososphaerota archaeon]
MSSEIDKKLAIEIARRLLGQHYVINSLDAVLEDDTWIVTGQVQLFDNRQVRKIIIDARTGRLKGHTSEKIAK